MKTGPFIQVRKTRGKLAELAHEIPGRTSKKENNQFNVYQKHQKVAGVRIIHGHAFLHHLASEGA